MQRRTMMTSMLQCADAGGGDRAGMMDRLLARSDAMNINRACISPLHRVGVTRLRRHSLFARASVAGADFVVGVGWGGRQPLH